MDDFFILPVDRHWLEDRITSLEEEIRALGEEFHEVLTQSSETWHDNAPFDAVRDKQSLLVAEREHYRELLQKSTLVAPVKKAGLISVGDTVTLLKNGASRMVFIAGDWSPQAGIINDGVLTVSRQSPLAQAVIGHKLNVQTQFGTIVDIH